MLFEIFGEMFEDERERKFSVKCLKTRERERKSTKNEEE